MMTAYRPFALMANPPSRAPPPGLSNAPGQQHRRSYPRSIVAAWSTSEDSTRRRGLGPRLLRAGREALDDRELLQLLLSPFHSDADASTLTDILLDTFRSHPYPNEIGPGVYDIHSPRVAETEEMSSLLKRAVAVIPPERLWVNPDCGLKTRRWDEVKPSLLHMVEAAKELRSQS